jgi:hypothetical protein
LDRLWWLAPLTSQDEHYPTLSRENRVPRWGTFHDGLFLPGGLYFDLLRNQFPNADHFLAVIGEAWLHRNKPPNDGSKAFELRHEQSLRCSAVLRPVGLAQKFIE